jgi:hypothetical protein
LRREAALARALLSKFSADCMSRLNMDLTSRSRFHARGIAAGKKSESDIFRSFINFCNQERSMASKIKFNLVFILVLALSVFGLFIYFKYFFTFEQRQQVKRQIGSLTGQNLTVTVFGYDGKVIKRWTNVAKITSGRAKDDTGERNYTYFYTRDNKYVQIPDSVWYIAEEE